VSNTEYVLVDVETGDIVDGDATDDLASVSRGEAWRPSTDPGRWHLRSRNDPPGVEYRQIQVLGGPDGDPNWYENTVENLDTSES
jgi:hypothetical protein